MILQKKMLLFLKVVLFSVFLSFTFPTKTTALGDPLSNLRIFFVDLFRVQIDSPATILLGRDRQLANTPPADVGAVRALHIIRHVNVEGFKHHVSCDDIAILGFNEWEEGFRQAQETLLQAESNVTTKEMWWPTFWKWNSPVDVSLKIKRNFWGNLRAASVSVAVIKGNFQISNVLDQSQSKIRETALRRVFEVRGKGYESLFEYQIDGKRVSLLGTDKCNDFSIFRLEVK
ncbi:hypothetical protein [Polycladidibacter hongkongensis]|uniref:hypothetical protein n=1 Tax=Polycladidibacter hongkongensis TaxID=1647556 RepID=UPI0008338624|nr:hypothetical protein [Pseudovibrio hongkongensis]